MVHNVSTNLIRFRAAFLVAKMMLGLFLTWVVPTVAGIYALVVVNMWVTRRYFTEGYNPDVTNVLSFILFIAQIVVCVACYFIGDMMRCEYNDYFRQIKEDLETGQPKKD